MKRKVYIIIQSIISFIAVAYQGINIVDGEYIWLDKFTEAFNGFGVSGMLIPLMILFFYYFIDEKISYEKNDKKFVNFSSVIFSLIMGIGKYYQYKVISLESDLILYFQISLIPIMIVGFYFLFIRVLKLLLYFIDKANVEKKATLNEIIFDKYYCITVIVSLILSYLPYLVAFYPASISYDGSYQIGEYLGQFMKTDHHPPFVTYFYGFFANLFEKTRNEVYLFIIIFTQLVLILISAILIFGLLKKCRIPYKFRWCILIFYSFLTFFPIYTVTIVKDSLYYPLTVIYTILLIYGLLFPKEYLCKISYYFKLTITLIFMVLIRNNGIYAFLLSFPLFIIICKNYRIQLGVVLVSVLLISSGVNQFYFNNGVKKLDFKIDMYTVMFQQTARYGAEHLEDVTMEEYKTLDEIFEYWRLPYEFNPRNADYAKNCLRVYENKNKYILEDRLDDYITIWAKQLRRHPLSYISSFIEGSYGYYYPDIKEAYEGLGWYKSINEAYNSFHFANSPKTAFLRSRLEEFSYLSRDLPFIGLFYSCGFYAWIVIGSIIYLITHKQLKQVIYLIPALVNILVCCVSPISGYIRYALPVIATAPIFMSLIYWNRKLGTTGDERK